MKNIIILAPNSPFGESRLKLDKLFPLDLQVLHHILGDIFGTGTTFIFALPQAFCPTYANLSFENGMGYFLAHLFRIIFSPTHHAENNLHGYRKTVRKCPGFILDLPTQIGI
jgi:hypothetical protein